jgi:hypothetical protein
MLSSLQLPLSMQYRMMDTKHKVRLHPGYVLRAVDLMAPVEIAEDFTLGDLCRIVDHFEEIDIKTFSALLHCPLKPFLEECLRPRDTSSEPTVSATYAFSTEALTTSPLAGTIGNNNGPGVRTSDLVTIQGGDGAEVGVVFAGIRVS